MEMTEDRTGELKDRFIEFAQSEQQRLDWEKMNRVSRTCATIKKKKISSIHTLRVPEGKERRDGTEKVFIEIMTQNSSNLVEDVNLYIQVAEQPQTR